MAMASCHIGLKIYSVGCRMASLYFFGSDVTLETPNPDWQFAWRDSINLITRSSLCADWNLSKLIWIYFLFPFVNQGKISVDRNRIPKFYFLFTTNYWLPSQNQKWLLKSMLNGLDKKKGYIGWNAAEQIKTQPSNLLADRRCHAVRLNRKKSWF